MSESKQKLGVIIGRFQPMHNGHKALIKKSMETCEKTLVLVGSPNKPTSYKNPLTIEERLSIVTDVSSEFAGDILIKELPDHPQDGVWMADIISRIVDVTDDCPPHEVIIYTAEKDKDFYESHFIYPVVPLASEDLSATDVRELYYDTNVPLVLLKDMIPQETMILLAAIEDTDRYTDLRKEYYSCKAGLATATLAHAFNNPIEPVCHAAVIHKNKLLLVKRKSLRGNGQWAIPGGFLEKGESTKDGALRELFEETGVSLEGRNAAQIACTVEENLDDLSVRTLGINYLFVVAEEESIDVFLDDNECSDYKWVPMGDILEEKEILFYNHNVVFQRLVATWDTTND